MADHLGIIGLVRQINKSTQRTSILSWNSIESSIGKSEHWAQLTGLTLATTAVPQCPVHVMHLRTHAASAMMAVPGTGQYAGWVVSYKVLQGSMSCRGLELQFLRSSTASMILVDLLVTAIR